MVGLISLLDRWARSSQQQARRNAMVASTRLTQRRIEREEVDRYLADVTGAARYGSTGLTASAGAGSARKVAAGR